MQRNDGTETVYPRAHDWSRYAGYYVNDNQPASNLPVYTLLFSQFTTPKPAIVHSYLDCDSYVRGHFACGGDVFSEVAVRFRGNTGCALPKRHFKVRFNHGRLFQGLRKINLNSLYTDKALLREHMAWDFLRDIGSAYCETAFVRLHINGEYYGLYMYLEHPDSRFLARNGLNADGDLFKMADLEPFGEGECGWRPGMNRYPSPLDYERYWERETNEESDLSLLIDFVGELHASGGNLAFLEATVDPESLILFQIGQTALHNFDSRAKNYFLHNDPFTGLWRYFPWDLDLSFGKYFTLDAVGLGRPVGTLNDLMACPDPGLASDLWWPAQMTNCDYPGNWLLYFFFNAGGGYWQRAYLVRFWDVFQEKYRRDRFDARIEKLYTLLVEEQAEDLAKWRRYPSNANPPVAPEIEPNLEILKEQITCRRDTQLLPDFPQAIREHPRLRITELMAMPDPAGPEDTEESLEYLELYNPDDRTIALGAWSIGGIEFTFPAASTIGPHGVLVVARDPVAFESRYGFRPVGPYPGRLENAGERLRVFDAGLEGDAPAVVDFLPYSNDVPWPEPWRGHSVELIPWEEATVDNDRGELWQRSPVRGGTPGTLPGQAVLFKRGDVDQNGRLQITDAIALLGYLFLNGPEPGCLDAADMDNDARTGVGDAIYFLSYLFINGPAPHAPFETCGADTGESLGCGGFPACGP